MTEECELFKATQLTVVLKCVIILHPSRYLIRS